MTTPTDLADRDDLRAEAMLLEATEAFDRAVAILRLSCQQLESKPTTGEVDLIKSVRQMNGAFLFTMEMREKAREAGSKRFGPSGAGKLDLDSARVEIGLRLACLRDAGEGDEVS